MTDLNLNISELICLKLLVENEIEKLQGFVWVEDLDLVELKTLLDKIKESLKKP